MTGLTNTRLNPDSPRIGCIEIRSEAAVQDPTYESLAVAFQHATRNEVLAALPTNMVPPQVLVKELAFLVEVLVHCAVFAPTAIVAVQVATSKPPHFKVPFTESPATPEVIVTTTVSAFPVPSEQVFTANSSPYDLSSPFCAHAASSSAQRL